MSQWLRRFVFYLWFHKLSLHKWRSLLHRWWDEREYLHLKLDLYSSHQALCSFVRNRSAFLEKKRDGFLSPASSPQYVQEALFGRLDPYERFHSSAFAVFLACTLDNSIRRGKLPAVLMHSPSLLTVLWQEHDGTYRIRHACVVMTARGTYAYMDRGLPTGQAPSFLEISRRMVKHYCESPSTLLAWAVAEPDLTPVYAQWRWRP